MGYNYKSRPFKDRFLLNMLRKKLSNLFSFLEGQVITIEPSSARHNLLSSESHKSQRNLSGSIYDEKKSFKKFDKIYFKKTYSNYVTLLGQSESVLSELMFGKTAATHTKKKNAPAFTPDNPYIDSESHYHRVDPIYKNKQLQELVKTYDSSADFDKFVYIPVTLSDTLSLEDAISNYLPQYKNATEILKKDNCLLAFIKIKRSEEWLVDIRNRLAALGLIVSPIRGLVTSLGLIASPWLIANETQKLLQKQTKDETEPGFNEVIKELLPYLPSTLDQLKEDPSTEQLIRISQNNNSPTQILAKALLGLIDGLPKNIDQSVFQRLGLFLGLAANFYEDNYDKFALITYTIVHEISLLISEGKIRVSFEDFKKDIMSHAIPAFGLLENSKINEHRNENENSNTGYRYFCAPANSGTNAFAIALNLALKADGSMLSPAIIEKGPQYFEFAKLNLKNNLSKLTDSNKQHDIYLITTGPTVWTEIYPGLDINQTIREIINKSSNEKPFTLIVDSTSGLYENLRIAEDLKEYINSGRVSIIVHESHQKFGLLHTDQAQYGRVFGICSNQLYSSKLIDEVETNAEKDLRRNIDEQIGAFINIHTSGCSEEIKKRHFKNGEYFRELFTRLKLHATKISNEIGDLHNVEKDALFVYGAATSKLGKIIKKHLQKRDSFGHFNTTWTDCGPFFRISPSGSDKIDTLIEGTELYLASQFSNNELFSILKDWFKAQKQQNEFKPPTLPEQIVLVSILIALKKNNFLPKTLTDDFVYLFCLNFINIKCDQLAGRKSVEELKSYYSEKIKLESNNQPVLNIIKQFLKQSLNPKSVREFDNHLYQLNAALKYNALLRYIDELKAKLSLIASGACDVENNNQISEIFKNLSFFRNPINTTVIIKLNELKLLKSDIFERLFKNDGGVVANALFKLIKNQLLKQQGRDLLSDEIIELISIPNSDLFCHAVVILADNTLLTRDNLELLTNKNNKEFFEIIKSVEKLNLIQDDLKILTENVSLISSLNRELNGKYGFLFLSPEQISNYVKNLSTKEKYDLYITLNTHENKLQQKIPNYDKNKSIINKVIIEKQIIQDFIKAYKKECWFSFFGNINRSNLGKKVFQDIIPSLEYVKEHTDKPATRALTKLGINSQS